WGCSDAPLLLGMVTAEKQGDSRNAHDKRERNRQEDQLPAINLAAAEHQERHDLNRTGNRGGCLVKVKQVPQRVLQVADSTFLRLLPAGCLRSIPAGVGG